MSDEISGAARSPVAQKSFEVAMKAMDQGDFKKAHSAFKKFVAEHTEDAEGWYYLAESGYYAAGMFGARVKDEEIIEAYTKAIELDGNRPEFYQSYGHFCIEAGKYDEAEKAYAEAVQIDSSLAASLYSEFAIDYFDNVMAKYGEIMDDPKARAPYAKKALMYMLKALELDPEEAKSLL